MAKKAITAKNSGVQQRTNNDPAVDEPLDQEWIADKISPYIEAYPNETCFLISSDGQVFLGISRSDAENHQRRIKRL
jgi:hypothetical protein